jgi:protein tyrosine phosphatase (PTP) superfamily phosphohydrolase (DUF442 family)
MLNYDKINENLEPIKKLDLYKFEKINEHIYLSTFPTDKDLELYYKKYHIKRVITLLNYKMFISKELLKREESTCKKLGIDLAYIPISYFNVNPMDASVIKFLLSNDKRPTLIHAYFFDKRMDMLEQTLK